jgi:hypothetical protein
MTDETGRFVLDGLIEARYQMAAAVTGYQRFSGFMAEPGNCTVEIPLIPSARIEGRCIDVATGQPLTRFQLALSPTPDAIFFPIQGRQNFEDPDGRFVFKDARAGDSYLIARAPGYAGGNGGPYAIVPEGVITDTIVRMEKGATVTGIVTDQDGAPLDSASVSLVRRTAQAMDPGARIFQELINSQVRAGAYIRSLTDSKGHWKIEGVLAGMYEAKVEKSGYSPQSGEVFTCPSEGEFLAPKVALLKGATIFGKILTPENEPDHQATVMITGIDVAPPYSSSATTNREGVFRVTGLRPGSYRLVLVQVKGQFDLLKVLNSKDDNTNVLTVAAGKEVEAMILPTKGPR